MRIITSLLLFISFIAGAQTPDQNHSKYWYYRDRLNNDFTYLGIGEGRSLIAGQRAYGDSTSNQLKFGDVTIRMGWHLGVLATEYALLKKNGQNTDKTVEELYYVIQAFNRLDENAESYFRCRTCPPSPQPGDLNGFFIRDDIHTNFLSDPNTYQHFNQHTHSQKTVSTITSDFNDSAPQIVEESHDQVWHLLIGFSLITKLVDEEASFNGIPLVNESREIVHRVMNYMMQTDWIIKNPVTGANVLRGDNAQLLSRGANLAASRIDINNLSLYQNDSLSNADFYKNIWQAYQNMNSCVYPPPSNNPCKEYHKILTLAVIGHSWVNTSTGDSTTGTKVNSFSKILRFEHLPLLNKVLNPNDDLGIADTLYEGLMNSAPATGPYNYGYPLNSSTYEWSSTNRFLYPERRGYNSTSGGSFFPGEYPGLDYMLIFNLYNLYKGSDYLTYYGNGAVTSSTDVYQEITIGCYPNPFTSSTNICINKLPNEPVTFILYDVLGKEVRRENLTSTTQTFERKDLSAGVYIYRLKSLEKIISTGKIVVR